MDELKNRIKEMIVTALELEDVTAADIVEDAPLFGESERGLGLDSIDALELGIAIKENFGVSFSAANEDTKKHFYSFDTLAAYISANMPK
ncbi:phosphopantetheine-binding protein [Fibrobacter succinogenes]|uniref:phosphopantetheine-binding protein n=1 Tax=Fibrobacter succinogenes TaxID=833 RepID=UPI0015639BDC|nr:phosphopantetheine-binding protein [Fibrobacter succinogenes]